MQRFAYGAPAVVGAEGVQELPLPRADGHDYVSELRAVCDLDRASAVRPNIEPISHLALAQDTPRRA
jgi:hypothetical protein